MEYEDKLKAIVCVGVSASGKSTWAEDLTRRHPSSWVEVNRDNIRFASGPKDWNKYKFTKANERNVTESVEKQIEEYAKLECNIVQSDTNLTKKYRDSLISLLESYGYEVEVKVFHISLEEAWKRDANRQGGVGHSIIYSQYEKYLDFIGRKTYEPSASLPKAVICDIDGTVAHMHNRGPFEWDKVAEDLPKTSVISMLHVLAKDSQVIFLSGRDGKCFRDTEDWLVENLPQDIQFRLLMRRPGDNRKDAIIKEELFWSSIADYFFVDTVIDDRPCMIRLWYELGISNVVSVGNPWKEF